MQYPPICVYYHHDFSGFLHTHPSIDQESAFWGFKGDQDFVGVALRA